jgi:hypothetical protein
MALYLISYDIAEKNHDYQSLWDRLAALKAVKILYSEWLLKQPDTNVALDLANDLAKHIMSGDSLLVQEVGADAAWIKLKVSDDAMRSLLTAARF